MSVTQNSCKERKLVPKQKTEDYLTDTCCLLFSLSPRSFHTTQQKMVEMWKVNLSDT